MLCPLSVFFPSCSYFMNKNSLFPQSRGSRHLWSGTIWFIMCSDELISRGTQINQTWIHCLILSRSLLDPLPPFFSCYYGIIGMCGGGQVDQTCSLRERKEECVIWTWGGGNDHQQNQNKWVVIPQEEIYPHLFLVMKSMNWPVDCVFQSYCFLKTDTDHFQNKVAHIDILCCYSKSVGICLLINAWKKGVMVTKLIWRSLQTTVILLFYNTCLLREKPLVTQLYPETTSWITTLLASHSKTEWMAMPLSLSNTGELHSLHLRFQLQLQFHFLLSSKVFWWLLHCWMHQQRQREGVQRTDRASSHGARTITWSSISARPKSWWWTTRGTRGSLSQLSSRERKWRRWTHTLGSKSIKNWTGHTTLVLSSGRNCSSWGDSDPSVCATGFCRSFSSI